MLLYFGAKSTSTQLNSNLVNISSVKRQFVKKYKVAFVPYDRLEPSSGIGNVCKQFDEQLSQFEDIELLPLVPPKLQANSPTAFIKLVNKILFSLWYKVVMPLRVLINRADIYVEMNMLTPPILLKKVSFLVYDLAFVHHPNVVTRRNYYRRISFLDKLPAYQFQHMVISAATKSDLVKYTGVNQNCISVCYLASFLKIISESKIIIENFDGYFLFVGTIEPRKNIIEIIKAFYLFIETTKANFKLILIGKMGWLMDELDGVLDAEPEKRQLVELIGYVDDETLSRWYNGAKALLFPSLYEGFGLPILEAMAHNTPVITCRNSSLVEVGGDAVLYTEPDHVSISNAMQKLWADPELVDLLVDKGKAQMMKFSWENFGKCVHAAILSNVQVK